MTTDNLSPRDYVSTLRASHDQLVGLVADLDVAALTGPSYDTDWNIGQVLSHMGSQAEIFDLILDANAAGTEAPGVDVFRPIWAVWDAKEPEQWRTDSIAANERHITRLEAMSDGELAAFRISLFGLDLDMPGFVAMRLSEHAIHTWDVDVALDPTATVAPAAVNVIAARLPSVAARATNPAPDSYRVRMTATDGEHDDVVVVGETIVIEPVGEGDEVDGHVTLPTEAYVRLVFGRLDPDHTPVVTATGTRGLDDLRTVFVGF